MQPLVLEHCPQSALIEGTLVASCHSVNFIHSPVAKKFVIRSHTAPNSSCCGERRSERNVCLQAAKQKQELESQLRAAEQSRLQAIDEANASSQAHEKELLASQSKMETAIKCTKTSNERFKEGAKVQEKLRTDLKEARSAQSQASKDLQSCKRIYGQKLHQAKGYLKTAIEEKRAMEKALREAKEDTAACKGDLEHTCKLLKAREAVLSSLYTRSNAAHRENNVLKAELESVKEQLKLEQIQVAALAQQAEQLQAGADESAKTLKAKDEENRELASECEAAADQNEVLVAEQLDLKQQVEDLKQELADLGNAKREAEEEYETCKEALEYKFMVSEHKREELLIDYRDLEKHSTTQSNRLARDFQQVKAKLKAGAEESAMALQDKDDQIRSLASECEAAADQKEVLVAEQLGLKQEVEDLGNAKREAEEQNVGLPASLCAPIIVRKLAGGCKCLYGAQVI